MGRRKSIVKIEFQRAMYKSGWELLNRKKHKEPEKDFSSEEFCGLVCPLRNAVKKVGLKLTSGRILRKNNREFCEIMLFPKEVDIYPYDNGDFRTYWRDVVAIKATYDRRQRRYKIKILGNFDEKKDVKLYDTVYSVYPDQKTNGLTREEFDILMKQYALALREIGLVNMNSGIRLAMPYFRGGKFSNFTPIYQFLFVEDFDTWRAGQRGFPAFFAREIESLFFSATLFSLCKPLFKECGIKDAHTEFALQILPTEDIAQQKEVVSFCCVLNAYVKLWCDFRPCEHNGWNENEEATYHLLTKGNKFWNNWTKKKPAAVWKHLGFPLVYSNYKEMEWGEEEPEFYKKTLDSISKKRLKEINQTSCLPLIFPFARPPKPYPESDCLTVVWRLPTAEDIKKIEHLLTDGVGYDGHHEHIKAVYYKFMALLFGKTVETIKKPLQKAYQKALDDIGAPRQEPSMEQQHKACLLGSLYYASAVFEEAGIEDRYTQFKSHIRGVKKFFGHQAAADDFAAFVNEALREDSKYHSILFAEDEDGIYLKYKMYWAAFEDYCKKNGVVLHQNALQFRKRELIPQEYIQPQYRVSDPDKYVRYDYRKKIDGKEETVLNVSRRILKRKSLFREKRS